MRVVPAWLASPAKSKRQRPCGQISLARPTATSRSTRSRPCSTCSSTKVPTRSSDSSPADGSRPAAGDGVGEEDAVAVAQLAGLGPRRRAGDQPGAQAGAPEPRPLLLDEDAEPRWTRRLEAPRSRSSVDRGQRGHDAQRTVVRPAVEDGVEVRAGERRPARPVAPARLPPGDLVADAVGLDDEPARRALLARTTPAARPRRWSRAGGSSRPRTPTARPARGRATSARSRASGPCQQSTGIAGRGQRARVGESSRIRDHHDGAMEFREVVRRRRMVRRYADTPGRPGRRRPHARARPARAQRRLQPGLGVPGARHRPSDVALFWEVDRRRSRRRTTPGSTGCGRRRS